MSAARRAELHASLLHSAALGIAALGIGSAPVAEIDALNILEASLRAMARVAEYLAPFMALAYLVLVLAILLTHPVQALEAVRSIIEGAFGLPLLEGVVVGDGRAVEGGLEVGLGVGATEEVLARADLAAMTRMAEGEAATARNQVLAARQRVLALRDDVLPRARQAIDPSVSAYAAGTMPLVSVIDTAQALWSIEAELVAAEFELGLAWARLQRAQGRFEEGAR